MKRLDGKRALITGAGSGMGRAAALLFAREGCAVAVADIDATAVASVVREIEAAGGRVSGHICNVTEEQSVAECVAAAAKNLGGLDVCWANAGTGDSGSVVSTPLEHWERVLRINLTGMFLTAKYVVPHMLDAGGGSIMFTSSAAVMAGVPGVVSNMGAKGGVLGLTRQISAEYVSQRIRANAICPGVINTPALIDSLTTWDELQGLPRGTNLADMIKNHPLGRLGEPEDIANVALFLASDESQWVNSQFINVSGTGH